MNIEDYKYKTDYSKEDIFRAAEIMASTKVYNVEYTALILSNIIPLPVIQEAQQCSPVLFSERLRELMGDAELTIRGAEKLYGWPTTTMSRWRNGTAIPSEERLKEIAEVFGVSVGYLTGRSDRR